MLVKRLVAADAARYRELMLHAYAAAPDAFTSTVDERAAKPESWWLERIAGPGGHNLSFGAFHEDRLVGTATLLFGTRPRLRHKAELVGVFVHESCRGRGAGAMLIQTALAAARARPGVCVVTLTVTEGNGPAIRLYERSGFRRFGVEPLAVSTPRGYLARVHMWLPLAEPDSV